MFIKALVSGLASKATLAGTKDELLHSPQSAGSSEGESHADKKIILTKCCLVPVTALPVSQTVAGAYCEDLLIFVSFRLARISNSTQSPHSLYYTVVVNKDREHKGARKRYLLLISYYVLATPDHDTLFGRFSLPALRSDLELSLALI